MERKLISIREYARMKGCSDTNVHKAINTGKIVKGIVREEGKRPMIDPAVADEEWGFHFNPNKTRNDKLKKQFTPEEDEEENQDEVKESKSTAAIKNMQAKVKLQREMIELQQLKGQLVDKDTVYKGLFAAGQELRENFMSLPDQLVDHIMAAKDRHEGYTILHDGIVDVLNKLSEIQGRKFA